MSQHQIMNAAHKVLILADESAEFPAAATYAGLHARAMQGGVVMLVVIQPAEFAHWSLVEQDMRREAQAAARKLGERFAAEIWAECRVETEIVLREGETRQELRRLIDEDPAIRALVLAAGAGREGPGPLVSSIARGAGLANRPLPVIVVPGALARDEIRALAAPGAVLESPSEPNG